MKATKFFEALGLKAYVIDYAYTGKDIVRYSISGSFDKRIPYYEDVWEPSDIFNRKSAEGIYKALSRFYLLFGFKDDEKPSEYLKQQEYRLNMTEHKKALEYLEKNFKDAPLTSIVRVILGKEELENDLPKVKDVVNTIVMKWYEQRRESWLTAAMVIDLNIPIYKCDTSDFLGRLVNAISIKYPEVETHEQLKAVQKILGNSFSSRGFAGRVKKLFKETGIKMYGEDQMNTSKTTKMPVPEVDDVVDDDDFEESA